MIKNTDNIWLDGIMGVIIGDALGCPVQFMSRDEIAGRATGDVTSCKQSGAFLLWETQKSASVSGCSRGRDQKYGLRGRHN